MIEITNQQLFDKTVSNAIVSAVTNSENERTAGRWTRAIERAVKEITENPFLDYDAEKHTLLICSPSNNIYSANSVCQCKAFTEFGVPCWHRAAARLVRLYFEALSVPAAKPAARYPAANREMDAALYITPFRKEEPKVGGFRL